MAIYNIYTQNSNGSKSLFKEAIVLKNDEEAQALIDKLEKEHAFKYSFRLLGDQDDNKPEADPLANKPEETEEVEEETEDADDSEEDKEESTSLEGVEWDEEEDEDAFPRGWHRKSEFVSKYGTVFHTGEEQPDLFRTVEPSEY